jgi:MoaA/NifB/PqqE/SkfB family radical SAM enzyme
MKREFDMAENGSALYKPLGLLAELTHRCPLGCPYCSNPLALDPRISELDTQTWARVFAEAAALNVLQVHLSGGEPGARRDLVAIMAAAHAAGLYTNLITSAVGITADTLRQLAEAGLDHVQISIQDSERASADRIAGYEGAFARKCALAAEVVHLKIPLTVNAVMHRANIDHIEDMVALALALGASRVEIPHVQYYGWALKNRAALMPSAAQVKRAAATVEELRRRHHGKIVIDAVVPDYYARSSSGQTTRRQGGSRLPAPPVAGNPRQLAKDRDPAARRQSLLQSRGSRLVSGQRSRLHSGRRADHDIAPAYRGSRGQHPSALRGRAERRQGAPLQGVPRRGRELEPC